MGRIRAAGPHASLFALVGLCVVASGARGETLLERGA